MQNKELGSIKLNTQCSILNLNVQKMQDIE